jgi:hypothetical protein
MIKVLMTVLCLLLACPSLAPAGSLQLQGQAFVFGIFGAPPPAQMTWVEADGATKLGNGLVTGTNPVSTDFSGKFFFNLSPSINIFRFNTFIRGDATYLNGLFHVVGNSPPITVLAGPDQSSSINGISVNMF